MTKKNIKLGGTPRFRQLEPGEECEFVNASIPEEFESEWDTGFGKNKRSKWSLTFTLLKHPHPSYSLPKKGLEVEWQTVAVAIRRDVFELQKTDDWQYWIDPEFVWTMKRRDDGSYEILG